MINGKTFLAIIPARGASKGIPKKNIKLLAGKPLIAWTIEEAKKSKYIDRLILSSEDEEIIKVAREWGCEVPFVRPKYLAADNTPGIDPAIHAINTISEKYDYVCLLQPTSPLRKVQDIDGCIEKCISLNAPSCVSVCEVDKHPYWMYSIDVDEALHPVFPNKSIESRQELPMVYALNGAVYLINVSELMMGNRFINDETIPYIMSKENSIDIDNHIDFKFTEFIINQSINTF